MRTTVSEENLSTLKEAKSEDEFFTLPVLQPSQKTFHYYKLLFLNTRILLFLIMSSPEHIANVFNFPLHTFTDDQFSTVG